MSIKVGSLDLNEEQYEGLGRFDSHIYVLREGSYHKKPEVFKKIKGTLGYWYEHAQVTIEDLRRL